MGAACLLLTFIFWGGVYVVGKLAADGITPPLLVCFRNVVASIPLLIMARPYLKTKIAREDRKYFFIIALFGYFATTNLVQASIKLTGASTASLVNALNPVTIMLLAALVLKEKITPVKVLCLILAMAGAMLIIQKADGQTEIAGILLALSGTLTWGIAAVLIRKLTAKYSAIYITASCVLISLLFNIPVGIAEWIKCPPHFTVVNILGVIYLGVIGSAISQVTWAKSLQQFPASTCSLFYPLQAVFSALLGAIFLNETITSTYCLGLLLVSADVALCTKETLRTTWKEPYSRE